MKSNFDHAKFSIGMRHGRDMFAVTCWMLL
jgi:hypothetical protein